MDWTKIPTTLITKRFSDYEISSIVKFQLVWAINEEQPDKKTCLRYMTSKQYETAMTYIDSISSTVSGDVSYVINKRNAEKKRYSKNKALTKILPADCQQSVTSLPEQIILDNIKEKEYKEKEKGGDTYAEPDTTHTPASASNQLELLEPDCSTYAGNLSTNGKNSRSSTLLTRADCTSWESLFQYWEQEKKGGKYKTAQSRLQMLNRLKNLTGNDFGFAKVVIFDAVDKKWIGFCGNNGLYFKGVYVADTKLKFDDVLRAKL